MMKKILCFAAVMAVLSAGAQYPQAGADERTPSYSEYFSWINNTNEGPTAEQTQVNLAFFRWLRETYGMELDIYAFDAGAIDGAKMYGSTRSERFRRQFPDGFAPVRDSAARIGARLGVWGGPDGFGDTPEEAEERSDMMIELVRDHNFRLFKFDAVCGQLRPSKYGYFDSMMTRIREISPDFIFLNHRLQLGEGEKHSTTFLLGGDETYIDVHMTNDITATHHRAKALGRRAPEDLTRLTEDHGVCLSSCLDYWEDDLILQAFSRNLIVAPQIYANPWLLRDDEFPYLAYIFNLHRDYRDILVDGMRLPEDRYGPEAVSRGDGRTRFVTLRNLTWEPVKYTLRPGEEIGLTGGGEARVRLCHPYIYDMGLHACGSEVEVEVQPFRAALVKVTTAPERDRVALSGIPYHVINDKAGDAVEIRLLGEPGVSYDVRMTSGGDFRSAHIDGAAKKALLSGRPVKVVFDGTRRTLPYHYKVAAMQGCDIPDDIGSIYYATCFAADNNALEVRSLLRSGPTAIPEVQAARDAFFGQKIFREREIWDRNLFDGDPSTAFSVSFRWNDPRPDGESGFLLDMGECLDLDSLVLESFDEYSIAPLRSCEGVYAYVSRDLKEWKELTFIAGPVMELDLRGVGGFRYLQFAPCPIRLTEVAGYSGGKKVDSGKWRASNLFRPYGSRSCNATGVWRSEFRIGEVVPGSYLCVAVNGEHGAEGAWAGFKIDGEYVGCPDRAPSFTSNPWEYRSANSSRNYTYYLPLTPDMAGKSIEAYVMTLGGTGAYVNTDRPQTDQDVAGSGGGSGALRPEVWVTACPVPFGGKTLVLDRQR